MAKTVKLGIISCILLWNTMVISTSNETNTAPDADTASPLSETTAFAPTSEPVTTQHPTTLHGCGSPPKFPNSSHSLNSNTTYGTEVTYTCNTGYNKTGTSKIRCDNDGNWTPKDFKCTLIDCGSLPKFPNSSHSLNSNTTYGTEVTYNCNTGYDKTGTSMIRCDNDGNWTPKDFKCTLIDCGSLPKFPNSSHSLNSNTTYGTEVTYTCNTGYNKTGTSKIRCDNDGNWTPKDFKCTLIESKFGGACKVNEQCTTENASCNDNICSCGGYLVYTNGKCRVQTNVGDKCEADYQCTTQNASCQNETCSCDDDFYPQNETCTARPPMPPEIEILYKNVLDDSIKFSFANTNISNTNEIRINNINYGKISQPDTDENTLTLRQLASGTKYTFYFYIERDGIPSKHRILMSYTVPEIKAVSEVDITSTTEKQIHVELTANPDKKCEMYEFTLKSSSGEINSRNISRNENSTYPVSFTELSGATQYWISVTALAGRFRSDTKSYTAYTLPPLVKTAEVIKWYNTSLVLNATYDGPNSANISYCYVVTDKATNTAMGNDEECFLNTSNTQVILTSLRPGTEYIVDIYSYLNLANFESRRSEYSFYLTNWTRPQNPTSLEVISRSERDMELKWKVDVHNDVEKVVIDVYDGTTFKSQDTINKDNATTGNHTVSGLDAGTEYTIQAYTLIEREINLTSEGNYSIPAYTRPSTPNVTVLAQEETSLQLYISCESDFDQIRVTFVGDNIPKTTVNVTDDGEAIVSQLEYGTNYTMEIFSMISGIESEHSTTVNTFTRPGPAQNISFPLDSLEEGSLCVKWEKPDGNADSFILHFQNKTYNYSSTMTLKNDLAYNFSGLEAGKQYSVNIVTVWKDLTSTSNATGTIYTRPYPPSTNSYFIADITTSTFAISLNTTHQPYDYISFIYRNDENETQTYPIKQTAFNITNLSEGTEYIIHVYSIIGGISSKRYQTLISYTLPGKVTKIMGNFEETTDTNLSVVWTQPQGHVDQYTINATCKSPNRDSSIKTQWTLNTSGNATEVTLSPLDPGTNCNVSVRAVLNNTNYSLNDLLLGEIVESSSNTSTREAAPGKVVIESIVTSSTSLNITWNPPNTPNGIIRKYIVLVQDNYRNCIRARYSYSCNSSKCDDVHGYNCSSPSSLTSVNGNCSLSALVNKRFEDPNGALGIVTRVLHPYRNYTVTVQAFTKCWGDENKSINQTEIDEPSQSPSNFNHNVTNSSITITWNKLDPLTDGNGPIQVYTIRKQYRNSSCSDQGDGEYVTETVNSSNSYIVLDKLRPYWKYNISVSASTSAGEGPRSDCTTHNTCNILTDESDPAVIQNQTLEEQKTSVNVTWLPPCRTNGIITSYILKVINTNTHEEHITSNNDTHAFISGLLPYRNYTVQVAASTKIGQGQFSDIQKFRTLVDIPRIPRHVKASVDQAVATTLNVIWSQPDLYTGPTKYKVTATDTISSDKKTCITGVDFNATSCNVEGLDAYWNYTVTVESITDAGSNWSITITATTGETAPGQVQSIMLLPEKNLTSPRSILVSWKPPSIRDLNGKLIYYYIVVNKTQDNNGETVEFNLYTVETDPTENTSKLTDNISPGNYTISVIAATEVGNGTINSKFAIVQPGAPINDKENNTHLLMLPGPTNAVTDKEKQISVNLPMEQFLCDDTNGQLKKWGVIVVSAENIPSSETPFAGSRKDFFDLNKKSWFQVKDQSSFQAYRATPDHWNPGCSDQTGGKRRRRSSGQEYKPFTIGASGDCSGVQTTYCNGQLKPDQQYRVKSYACTDTGCTETRYSSPISTEPVPNYVPIIAGVVVGVVVIAVVAGIIVMKRRQTACFNKDVEDTSTHKPGDSINMDNVTNKSVKSSHRFISRPVKLPEFPDYVQDMHRDSDLLFADAFKMLRENSPSHSLNASEQQCSRPKNRYTNILPFDHSRVKLRPSDDIEGSDYINANYIPGYTSKREYIATQGPMLATFDDFWRMVWEQNVDTIVMLTKLMENGRHKCDRYWPEQGEPVFYGDLVVSIQSESNLSDYTLRIIEVKMKEDAKTIRQFCYLKWPDMGCPEKPEMLLEFVKEVRQYAKPKRPSTSGPIIVHCSAGVGRTGTFIAVDNLLQHIRDHDEIDVYKLVLDMRNHRLNMVQTEDQFIYIHECINSFISTDEDMEDDDEPVYENTRPGKAEENIYANTAFNSYE